MSETFPHPNADLAVKIARLVEEKGWNQEDLARTAGVNRHTARQILLSDGSRRLRNSTIASVAKALNLSVNELRTLPLERLLLRMKSPPTTLNGDEKAHRLYELATQPELRSWMERNPERSKELTPQEAEEVLNNQGALTSVGVETFIMQLERRRELIRRVEAIAQTEYLETLENMIDLIYDKVRPREP